MLLGLLRSARRRAAARKYARRLGPQLRRDYGAGQDYTEGQIRTAAEKLGLPPEHLAMAYAAFMPATAFAHAAGPLAGGDYESLRSLYFRSLEHSPSSASANSQGDLTGGYTDSGGGHHGWSDGHGGGDHGGGSAGGGH